MAEVTSHSPGSFSWPELSTTDQKGAVAFYRQLFGWDVNEQPIGPTETYSLFQMRGKDVASAYTMRPEERQHGAPPHWNNYITVQNADESATKAASLGGKVLGPPFDVMEHGRMAIVQDPTGAVFCLWQAKSHIGAKIVGEPGALCWTELTTSDTKAAERFYTQLFPWTAKHSAAGAPMEYTEVRVGDAQNPSIGMLPKPPQMPAHIPSYWMPYFQVADIDASTTRATGLGGRVMVGPQDIPNGRFVILTDPQGAMFAMYQQKA
jgi:predicted enzyme related to lactoylglutathione lyase